MRDAINMADVAKLCPEYMGFIFYKSSRRFVGDDFSIDQDLHHVKKVGVFVNASQEEIIRKARIADLQGIQLHGTEKPELCSSLKGEGFEVIKVFPVDEQFDFGSLEKFKPFVHYFLFDTKTDQYGGSGKTFDWHLLERYDQEVPFFLSGGISLANVNLILQLKGMNLYAIDANSGVEDEPGMKNIEKVKAMINVLNKL